MYCPSCGTQNPVGVKTCKKCGASLSAPPSVQPGAREATPTGARTSGGYVVARLGDRLLALILDSILGGAAFALIGMCAAVRLGGLTESGFSMEGTPALVGIGSAIVMGFLYYWLLEGLLGATLGKGIMGLRVRDKSGDPCGLKASLVRNLLRIVDAVGVYLVGFLVAILSKLRQRLGDHLAKTVVVENPASTFLRAVMVVLWLALVGGGVWAAYLVHRDAGVSSTARSTGTAVVKVPMPPTPPPSTTEASKPPVAPVAGELSVINFAFLQKKDGPARPQALYKPGEKVFAQFEVAGFTTDAEGRVNLLFDVVPLDPSGLRLYENWKATVREVMKDADGTVPSTFNFDLPSFAPSGTYRLQIKVHDAVKKADTELSPGFIVEAGQPRSATQLEVRDFQFSRSEDGPPEPMLVMEGGGKIHMAFKVAGMQFREDRPDVDIAMRVTGPGGETLLDRPNLVEIREASLYHPATYFKEITSWVTLPSNAAKGVYTVRFAATDKLAQRDVEHQARFEVR